MPRPVLVDIPLERLQQPVFDDPNLPDLRTGSKRSRSPSLARSIFSPAKRRILEQEGLFSPSQSLPYPSTNPHSLRSLHGSFLHAFDNSKHPSPAGLGDVLPSPPGDPRVPVLPPSRVSRRVSPRLSTTPQSRSLPTPTTLTRTSPRKTPSQDAPPHVYHTILFPKDDDGPGSRTRLIRPLPQVWCASGHACRAALHVLEG
jgi:hypothetical protein